MKWVRNGHQIQLLSIALTFSNSIITEWYLTCALFFQSVKSRRTTSSHQRQLFVLYSNRKVEPVDSKQTTALYIFAVSFIWHRNKWDMLFHMHGFPVLLSLQLSLSQMSDRYLHSNWLALSIRQTVHPFGLSTKERSFRAFLHTYKCARLCRWWSTIFLLVISYWRRSIIGIHQTWGIR